MNKPVQNKKQIDPRDRSMLWGISWVSLYTFNYLLVKIVRGLIVPRLLLPVYYGLWTSLSVVLGYTRYADLGVQYQLAKRLPYQLGKEGSKGYWELANRGMVWMTCVTMTVSAGLFFYSFLYQGNYVWFYRTALRLLALIVVVQNIRAFFSTMLSTRQEFRIVAINGMITDLVALTFAIAGLLTIGVIGLVWALLIGELAGALYCLYHLWALGIPRLRWKFRGIKKLIRGGLLLLGVAFLEQMMMTVDQLFLLRFYPINQYGIYALGLFIVSIMIAVSGIFLTAQPRILDLWGRNRQKEGLQLIETNLSLYILVIAFSICPFLLGTDLMLRFYLTEYAEGLSIYILMPVIAIARGPVILLRSYYLAKNREKHLIIYQIFGLLLAASLNMIIIRLGLDMAYIVLASTAGYLVTGVFMFRDFEREQESVGYAKYAMLLASLFGSIGLFLFYRQRGMQANDFSYLAETCGVCMLYLLLITGVFLATRQNWLGHVRFYMADASIPFLSSIKRWVANTMENR